MAYVDNSGECEYPAFRRGATRTSAISGRGQTRKRWNAMPTAVLMRIRPVPNGCPDVRAVVPVATVTALSWEKR